MKTKALKHVVLLSVVSALLLVSGCGGGDNSKKPIDLITDNDADKIPDELEQAVKATMKIADRENPGTLDPEEESDFFNAINDIGARLPFAKETIRRLEEIETLSRKFEGVQDEQELNDLLAKLSALEDELLEDPNYKIFDKALSKIPELNPAPVGLPASSRSAKMSYRSTATSGFEQLERGDIMLVHSGGIGNLFPWAWHFTHAGIYDGNNTVYESISSGVQLQSIEAWKDKQYYGFARNKVKPQSEVIASLENAKLKYGIDGKTKYNINFPSKYKDDALYCSQLAWKIQQGVGVDIDSNSLKWFALMSLKFSPVYALSPIAAASANAALIATVLRPAVAPDEIFYATDSLDFYYIGKNP